jgi:hypothetical protein
MRTAKSRLLTGASVFVVFAAMLLMPLRAFSAQVYLPNNNQWAGETMYQGATLILAYDDGNARTFTPEQVVLFNMASGWFSGAGQAAAAMSLLNQTPRGGRCRMYLEQLSLVDVARKYANYWTQHPEEHGKASLAILIASMYEGHPCN